MSRIVIVGGGVTGLAAAHEIERLTSGERAPAGRVECRVIEGAPRFGGKVYTERQAGFVIEGGPDSFVSYKEGVIQLAERVGVADRLIPSNRANAGSWVWSRGRLHRLPEGLLLMVPSRLAPFLNSSLLSWPGKLRMLLDVVIPRKRSDDDESLESFVTRRLGREALERIAEPLIAGIHSAPPSRMSVRAGFPRFVRMEEEYGSLVRAALAANARSRRAAAEPPADGADGANTQKAPRSYFMSFGGGMGELVEALVASLRADILRPNTTVERLESGGDGSRPRYRLQFQNGESIEADSVILATPARVTGRLLGGIAPQVAATVASIPQISTSTVTLAYRRRDLPRPLNGSGFVVPDVERRRIRGVTYLSQKWAGRVPSDEFVLLRAFVGGERNQQLAHADDDVVLTAVREELEQMLGIAAPPLFIRRFLWKEGMHQYTLGHTARVADVRAGLKAFPGIYVAGAPYEGSGLSDCIRTGWEAAAQAVEHVKRRAEAAAAAREAAK